MTRRHGKFYDPQRTESPEDTKAAVQEQYDPDTAALLQRFIDGEIASTKRRGKTAFAFTEGKAGSGAGVIPGSRPRRLRIASTRATRGRR